MIFFLHKALPDGEFQYLCQSIVKQVCLGKKKIKIELLTHSYWTELQWVCQAILRRVCSTLTHFLICFAAASRIPNLKMHLRLSEPVLEYQEL